MVSDRPCSKCSTRLACSSASSPPPSRSAASLDESSWRRHSLPIVRYTANHSLPPSLPTPIIFFRHLSAHELPLRANHFACLAMPATPMPCFEARPYWPPPFAQQHLTLSGAEICGVKGRGTSSFRGPTSLRSAAGPPQEPPEDNAPPAQRGHRRHCPCSGPLPPRRAGCY